jgi:hypothetical protein
VLARVDEVNNPVTGRQIYPLHMVGDGGEVWWNVLQHALAWDLQLMAKTWCVSNSASKMAESRYDISPKSNTLETNTPIGCICCHQLPTELEICLALRPSFSDDLLRTIQCNGFKSALFYPVVAATIVDIRS